jgi:hypothetical protein
LILLSRRLLLEVGSGGSACSLSTVMLLAGFA